MRIEITCPYCGNVFFLRIHSVAVEKIVCCGQEESDGCGQMFILTVTPRKPQLTYRKVEGEVDNPTK